MRLHELAIGRWNLLIGVLMDVHCAAKCFGQRDTFGEPSHQAETSPMAVSTRARSLTLFLAHLCSKQIADRGAPARREVMRPLAYHVIL